MPIYEYHCGDCRRKVSVFFRSYGAVTEPVCPNCGSTALTRLVSRAFVRRGSSADDGFSDEEFDDTLDGLDERDPRSLARAMRRMSEESGEAIEPEMEEALSRMERGEDAEQVLASLDDQPGDAGDDFDPE